MESQLPNDFDLIIIGTGIVESILSAAASRIGKRVLHIDRNDYYGGNWASFNLDTINKLQLNKVFSTSQNINVHLDEDEEFVCIGNELFDIENFTYSWHIPENDFNGTKIQSDDHDKKVKLEICNEIVDDINKSIENEWTRENLLKESRKFNIDLAPKLQYARGTLVELLISSNIARYSEYRSVSRVLTWLNGQLEVVPCSRSDVFANSKVSVIEKRMLMKLLTSLDDENEELKSMSDYENKTFRTFLKDKKLTPNLIHYVLYAISMSVDETLCHEGIENTKRFLTSLGRFGKTPFLFCMYGSGEITQAFCRLSAVFGGLFALGQHIDGFVFKDGLFESLVVGEQRIKANHIVMGIEKSPKKFVSSFTKKYISRAVFITDRSVMDSEKEHLTLLLYPPENNKNSVTIIELGSLTGTCPKKLYLVHLISTQKYTPQEDFKHVVENLFDIDKRKDSCQEKPQILWSCYFSLPDSNHCNLKENVPSNVLLCPGPDIDLDYDTSIKKAKEWFSYLYPDMDFLPRAPDPEEIVIGEDENDDLTTENNEVDNIVITENTVEAELIQNTETHNSEEEKPNENI